MVLTVWAEKLSAVCDRDTCSVTAWPVPKRLMVWGLPAALLTNCSPAVRAPIAEGSKVTFTVHPEPEVRFVGQSLKLMPKSPLFAPLSEMPLMVTGPVP